MSTKIQPKDAKESCLHRGDTIEVFAKRDSQKPGSQSQPIPVLKYNPESRTITITSSKGRLIDAAIEDVRHALSP